MRKYMTVYPCQNVQPFRVPLDPLPKTWTDVTANITWTSTSGNEP